MISNHSNGTEIDHKEDVQQSADSTHSEAKEQSESESKPTTKSKSKSKRNKKRQTLYHEDATRIFKKLNDGKRFKNGLSLSKTCSVLNVAWELPLENGRLLPSKVARHFKATLPSKKAKRDSNIKPSIAKSIATRTTALQSVSDHSDDERQSVATKPSKPQRRWTERNLKTGFHPISAKPMGYTPTTTSTASSTGTKTEIDHKPKQSMISSLEELLSSDPLRANPDDEDADFGFVSRAKTDADIDVEGHDEEHATECDIEKIAAKRKKKKKKRKGVKEQAKKTQK